jgi:hypothetical protein
MTTVIAQVVQAMFDWRTIANLDDGVTNFTE